jgi:orotate phosphoribosyltransferase
MSQELVQLFKDAGALLEGHFLLTSGLHSPIYWEKFKVLQYPVYTEKLCKLIADHYRDQNVQVVAGPTTGGIILAFEVARQLGTRGIFAEKQGDTRMFRRGFSINSGERVLIVDDILTTGSSVRETIQAIETWNGNIIGIGILVDRSSQDIEIGIPLFSCLRSVTETYPPDSCPLCAAGIPLVRPGG